MFQKYGLVHGYPSHCFTICSHACVETFSVYRICYAQRNKAEQNRRVFSRLPLFATITLIAEKVLRTGEEIEW